MPAFLGLGIGPAPIEAVPVEFGEWLPDLPEVNNPGAIEALNVIPREGCYVPFPSLAAQTGLTLANAVRGAIMAFDKSGQPQLFAATSTGIYQRQGSTFVNRYTTAFSLYSDFIWQFVQFGDYVVALHPQISPQASDVGGALGFSPLAGAPPIAACGARVGNFLVLGNLDGETDPNGSRWPSRIRWSGFDNIDAPWVSDPSTQADFNDMPSEGGAVVGITGREFGTVFQERAISRMSYVGLPTVFDIETVEYDRGALCTGGIIDIGTLVFFIANDGFFSWNGTNATPIGDNKVNRYFFDRLNYGARQRIVGAVDYINGCVLWAFPTGNSNVLNEVIVFSYKENRWSHAALTLDHLFNSATLSVSLDDFTGSLDAFPTTLDDGSFKGGRPLLGAFGIDHAFGLFNGPSLAAVIDTGEFGGPNGQRVFVNSARPIVDIQTPVATLQVARRDQLMGEAIVFDPAVGQEITGECPVLGDARYMRFRTNVPAGVPWRHARGVEVWRKVTGRV